MWKQELMGIYKKGTDELKVDPQGCGSFLILKNGGYENDIHSIEELNAYLSGLEAEELYLPKKAKGNDVWIPFENNEHYDRVLSRKRINGNLQTVLISKKDNTYSVYMRETDYECLGCLIETAIEFVEEKQRNPLNDVELDAYEAATHGASGMTEYFTHLSEDEMKNALEKYGIGNYTY